MVHIAKDVGEKNNLGLHVKATLPAGRADSGQG